MTNRFTIYVIFICILCSSCSNNLKIRKIDDEDYFLFKSETRLLNKNDGSILKKFLGYSFNEIDAKNKSLKLCNNFLSENMLKNVNCKIFNHKFTNYGESILED